MASGMMPSLSMGSGMTSSPLGAATHSCAKQGSRRRGEGSEEEQRAGPARKGARKRSVVQQARDNPRQDPCTQRSLGPLL